MKQCWHEITLLVPHLWNEVLPHFFEEKGFAGVWLDEEGQSPHMLLLRAYLRDELWEPRILEELRAELRELSRIFAAGPYEEELSMRVIEEEDWASHWLPFFQPLKIGSVWIRPSLKNVRLSTGEQEIILDPGQAFGTGHHECTQLCLEAILLVRPSLEDEASVLDLGTGSGILAMFAAKAGFRNILALDVDPVAVETALRNISTNGLERFIEVSNEPLKSIRKPFKLILANLSAPLLQNLADELRLHLEMDGWLVVAGFLADETDALLRSFYAKGLGLAHKKIKNDWACLILKMS